jgi:tRNA(fMet)-specific endonuclease VapC
MIVLDTDHLSILQHRDSRHATALRGRIESIEDEEVVTTVATYEEQMRSWLSQIGRYSDVQQQIPFYHRLIQLADFFADWELLPFTDLAADIFKEFRKQKVRISSTDLKIASIVLTYEATLLSANLDDFQRIPGLKVENWLSTCEAD